MNERFHPKDEQEREIDFDELEEDPYENNEEKNVETKRTLEEDDDEEEFVSANSTFESESEMDEGRLERCT